MKRKLIEELGNMIEGRTIIEDVEEDSQEPVDLDEVDRLLDEAVQTDETIKALRDTDYRDKEAFFKMVQLLKGLATGVDEDETAKEFMSAVSDALTSAAKKVLGEDAIEK